MVMFMQESVNETVSQYISTGIIENIENHAAWHGAISGLEAEAILRDLNTPFLFLLRSGEHHAENEADYYVSFIQADHTVRHTPFQITVKSEGWYWENTCGGGPLQASVPLDDLLHLIMKCRKNANTPLVKE